MVSGGITTTLRQAQDTVPNGNCWFFGIQNAQHVFEVSPSLTAFRLALFILTLADFVESSKNKQA